MLQSLQIKRKRGGNIETDHNNTNGDTKKIKTEPVQLKAGQGVQATAAQIFQPKAEQVPNKGGGNRTKKRSYHASVDVHPPTTDSSQKLKRQQRELLFDQASAIVRLDNSFLNGQNAKAQAAGSIYERNTIGSIYKYREWRVINTESQMIADKLRELSNARKLIWFNTYGKGHRKLGELYHKKLFKHQAIATLLSRLAKAARGPNARKTAKAPPLDTPGLLRTKEEQIMHHYPGLRALNQQAQADGSTYERNTIRKKLLGYTFLPRGNAYLTRRARELSNATLKIWFNVHRSNHGTLPRLGLLVQDSILVTAKRCEEETREYRESLKAKRGATKGSGVKANQTNAKEAVKKLPAEIPKKGRLAKDNLVAKKIIDLVSNGEGKPQLPNLEPITHSNESSDEEFPVDSTKLDSDWDPEKDDLEGVLVGETYELENGPRRTRRSHGVMGRSQKLGFVCVDDEEDEGNGEEEDEELRRLEGRVKHEPDGDEGKSMVRQEPGVREDTTAQEAHARIKAEMEGKGDAGWQDDFEWEMA
ncbi:hypothetical protein EV426DRAFT_642054 [Tirmania nivea]|nr:hypothetical protein EV426DRAFT_642054 [Tirmania nivea]